MVNWLLPISGTCWSAAISSGSAAIFFPPSVIIFFGKFTNLAAERNAEDKNRLNGSIVDIISNITSVKLFSTNHNEIDYIKQQQAQEIESNKCLILSYNKLRLWVDIPVTFTLIGLISALIVSWKHNLISAGDVAFITQSTYSVMIQIWFLGESLATLYGEIGLARQALTVLQTPHDVIDVPNAKILQIKSGLIEFDNVTFNYQHGNRLFQNKYFKQHILWYVWYKSVPVWHHNLCQSAKCLYSPLPIK